MNFARSLGFEVGLLSFSVNYYPNPGVDYLKLLEENIETVTPIFSKNHGDTWSLKALARDRGHA